MGIFNYQRVIYRGLATHVNQSLKQSSYKILVIGGGTAGISVTSKLNKHFGNGEIGVIEPNNQHYYQPLWTLVGAGIKNIKDSYQPFKEVIPKGVEWIQNYVEKIDAENNKVTLKDGNVLSYNYLIIAPGIELKWDKVKGLKEALNKDWVCSNYSFETVGKTHEQLEKLNEGNAVFTMPSTPIKCAGAPQKIAYLADSYLREKNIRDKVNLSYHTGIGKIFAIEKYANSLLKVNQEKQIALNYNQDLIEVKEKELVFKNLATNEIINKEYNFAHITPPMGPYAFLKDNEVTNEAGYVDVDQYTLIHNKYKNILSLGDASSLPTSKTAAAITTQSYVLSNNLLKLISDKKDYLTYDGYTSCPLFIGDNKLILAEFSGYSGQPQETLPFDQAQPSKLSYYLTKDILPAIYWNGLLKGNWDGPQNVRKTLNLFS
ncbi:FAD-dependent pyridine nucleotide-disulfide oxidoreductase [Neoconidiobolus thromboides FSU 785]|nr:FAD-dependent pyridine nucleotide-disulfide oxidoreductase [Neoconidiobolus thromboides FSU 785]